jgi:hypothetical protein
MSTWRESFTFYGLLARLRTLKVEPLAGKVLNREGIFDIQVINILCQTLIVEFKYLILNPNFFENRTFVRNA